MEAGYPSRAHQMGNSGRRRGRPSGFLHDSRAHGRTYRGLGVEGPGAFLGLLPVGGLGSAIGGLLPYGLGRAGGELFILKRVNRERYERMKLRFEKQEFLAMAIPSALPPPTPWKAFVFAAGVFEMRVIAIHAGGVYGQDGALAGALASGNQAWPGGIGDCAAPLADGAAAWCWGWPLSGSGSGGCGSDGPGRTGWRIRSLYPVV